MVGKTIAQFRIDEKLGQGGMGIVYKAHDTKLNRTVALKFLPAHLSGDAESKSRFIQEAQSASGLDHPNICTIYDIGETPDGELYIAMAYYDGETLKYSLEGDRMSIDEATSIARQIARALERAHEAGIVHRDVKPANIMLTRRGEIKLLDFGLAKLVGGVDMTKMGSTVGTAAYMSPEQMKGEAITSAADVWSLGALYFEMLTGEKPFKGEYDQALMYGILNETPLAVTDLRPDVPDALSRLISQCLEKGPESRPVVSEVLSELGDGSSSERSAAGSGFMSAPTTAASVTRGEPRSAFSKKNIGIAAVAAILLALGVVFGPSFLNSSDDGSGSSTVSEIDRSVAVLPFAVRSVEEGSDATVLAGGIHDDLLAQLAKIKDLRVISRTSVLQYANTTKSISEIANELDVATVLEGTLQRAGDRVRVNVSLVNAATDAQLWSETYNQELTTANIFAIQSDLARQIAGALNASLSSSENERLDLAPEISMEAYDQFTKAMFVYMGDQFGSRAVEASEMMQRVIEIEPEYARAHAALAGMLIRGVANSIMPEDQLERADEHINIAQDLEPDLVDAYIEKGLLAHQRLDYVGAEEALLQAIDAAPGDSRPLDRYAALLYQTGRPEEAIQYSRRSVEVNPLDVETRSGFADILFFVNDFQGSLSESLKVLELNPEHSGSYYNLGYCYAMLDRSNEAIAAFEKAVQLDVGNSVMVMGLAWVHAKAGNADEALAQMEEVENNATILREKAIIFGILGDLDMAFTLLNQAFDQNPGAVMQIGGDTSVSAEMRADPRFIELMEKLGLRQ